MAASSSSALASDDSINQLNRIEKEVADILCSLPGIILGAEAASCSRLLPEILSWGRRRRRTHPEGKAERRAAATSGGVASPDTPLAFPASGGEEQAVKKPRRCKEWVEEQSGVVARLSQENAHLLQQIEEYRARLESSRTMNENLKQMQTKLKQQQEEQALGRRPQQEIIQAQSIQARPLVPDEANLAKHFDRLPASGHMALQLVDLNIPARTLEAEAAEVTAAWYRGQQIMYKAAVTAEARKRRREIRRSKNSLLTTAPTLSYGMPRVR